MSRYALSLLSGWAPLRIAPVVRSRRDTEVNLCWAADAIGPEDFTVPTGRLSVSGPQWVAAACTQGRPCAVQLTGMGLAMTNVLTASPSGLYFVVARLVLSNPSPPKCWC